MAFPQYQYVHQEIAAEPYIHQEIAAEPYVHIEPALDAVSLGQVAPTGYAGYAGYAGGCRNNLGQAVECRTQF